MIPITLTVSNFMPYGANVPTISFAGIHVATICGDNGSGKSSIIDAMTWALWGKTRARTDDDLIHQGETAMQVQFDFAVGKQVYRVIRKHSKPKNRRASGQSSLDFFISNNGAFRPISADRLTETERKIAEVLHMDYETFVNSAFLRQGHADEFTVAKPAERKTVLTNILGLSTYDRLEMQARQMASQRESEKHQVENALREIERELEQKPAYEAEMAAAEEQLKGIDLKIAGCDGRLGQLRQERELLKGKQEQLAQLDEQILHLSRDLRRWSDQAGQNRVRVAEYERLLAERTDIEEKYSLLVSLRKRNEELNQKLRLVSVLNDRQHQLDIAVMKASHSLLAEHSLAANRVNDLQSKFETAAALRNDLRQAQAELSKTLQNEETITAGKQDLQSRQLEVRHLEADKTRTEREIVEIDDKLALLATGGQTKCPLCEQELGEEHLALIKTKYASDKSGRLEAGKSIALQLGKKKTDLARLEREIGISEAEFNKAKSGLQVRAGLLTRELSEAEEAGRRLESEKEALAGIEERLAKKDYAPSEQEELVRIEARIESLDYDARSTKNCGRSWPDWNATRVPNTGSMKPSD